jgi:NAD(P)H-dependent FMN reductase
MPVIVAISGSLRAQSSNTFLLKAAARVAPAGTDVLFYDGLATLPHFNPDLDVEGRVVPESVRQLRDLLIRADAVLVSCPEYAHGVPGSFKNMLDWLVSAGELVGKRIALLNASQVGGAYAQAQIVETLRTMNWNVVDDACRLEPFVPRRLTSDDVDEATRASLREALVALIG